MRFDAPIPALLALAAIFLSPVRGLAKPTHTLSHKVPSLAPAPKHAHRKGAASVASQHTRGGLRQIAEAPAEAKARNKGERTVRQRAEVRAGRVGHAEPRHRTLGREATVAAEGAVPVTQQGVEIRKATSEDFLRAASSPLEPVTAVAAGSGAVSGVQVPQPVAPSKPVSVVSVIRPTAEKPQLKSVEEVASTPEILPSLYNKRGRLIVPAPLKGSHEILVHQNQVADHDGLDRIQNDDALLDMRTRHLLVALPVNEGMQVDERLPVDRRYCRPWAAQFLAALARAHYAHFHTPLQVNSAVRTVEFQQHLIHINGNAAPAEGDTASPHLTGQAIDIAKHGLSLTEIAWMRGYLLPLVQEGKIDVEEEFQQSCFHISVYKRYLPAGSGPERDEAVSRRTAALAAAIR